MNSNHNESAFQFRGKGIGCSERARAWIIYLVCSSLRKERQRSLGILLSRGQQGESGNRKSESELLPCNASDPQNTNNILE